MNKCLCVFFFATIVQTYCEAFVPDSKFSRSPCSRRTCPSSTLLRGWLDNFLPEPIADNDDSKRRLEFPEQYPAPYEMNAISLESDKTVEARAMRPLLKQTMLESRPLEIIYDAEVHGWSPSSFHQRVDGRGAAVVVATYKVNSSTKVVGGYNPKGWASLSGARPSVAAFLFYQKEEITSTATKPGPVFQKLQKVGGGGLACGNDDPRYGISFGPDALVISFLGEGQERNASSKLGPYFERGPDNMSTLFEQNGGTVELNSLKVITGIYRQDEDIPYSGAVMDMTSG